METSATYKLYCESLIKKYGLIFCLVYLLVFITYSYFFTTIIFTNHTFPNILINQYPSFTTYGEGRWLGDIIRLIVGTSGVQSFQMFIGVGIQIINAFFFVKILRIETKVFIFFCTAFLSLHPVFLDYYSFNIDHISYTLGDSLALIGILILMYNKTSWKSVILCSLSFMLCISIYQPKLAFIGLLLIIYLIHEIVSNDIFSNKTFFYVLLLKVVLAYLFSVIFYYIIANNIIIDSSTDRNHINSIQEMLFQIINSFHEFANYFIAKVNFLPLRLIYLPIVCIVLGVFYLLKESFKTSVYVMLLVTFFVLLIPVALRTSYIINNNTWNDAGRIIAPYAYCLLFFLGIFYKYAWLFLKNVSLVIISVFLYFFIILGIQETNYVMLKSIYEQNKINRIIARIENEVPDLYDKQYGLVVIGDLNMESQNMMNFPAQSSNAHVVKSDVFESYRQVEILNYFLGKNIFTLISKEERESIIKNISVRQPWPSKESVFVHQDKTIVVLLKKYNIQEEITITK